MNNVMLDVETWGVRPGCAIRSVGAVIFDPIAGGVGAEFYANVDLESCKVAGLVMDPGTEAWWNEQSQVARDSLMIDQLPLKDVLENFVKWFSRHQGIFIWSHGANFDEPIIQAAMHAVGVKAPWRYSDVRDTRTIYELARFDLRSLKRSNGVRHNALDDAKHQVIGVQQSYSRLYNGRPA